MMIGNNQESGSDKVVDNLEHEQESPNRAQAEMPTVGVSVTTAEVDGLRKQRNKGLMWAGVRLVFALAAAICVGYIASAYEEESKVCETDPLSYHTFYTVYAVSSFCGIIMAALMLVSQALMFNRHVLRAAILKQQFREQEAEKELELGKPKLATGIAIIGCIICPACLWAFFGLAWGIVGWVEFANSDGDVDECGVFRTWWIVIFVLGTVSALLPQSSPKSPVEAS